MTRRFLRKAARRARVATGCWLWSSACCSTVPRRTPPKQLALAEVVSPATAIRHEIVFINAAINERQSLLAQIDSAMEIVFLDPKFEGTHLGFATSPMGSSDWMQGLTLGEALARLKGQGVKGVNQGLEEQDTKNASDDCAKANVSAKVKLKTKPKSSNPLAETLGRSGLRNFSEQLRSERKGFRPIVKPRMVIPKSPAC